MSDNRTATMFPSPPNTYNQFKKDKAATIVPPKPPAGDFQVFGETQSHGVQIPSLEERGITVLYDPNEPPLLELKKINHKILFAYQSLISVISTGNGDTETVLAEINVLYLNAYHLLQKLREVQAYEHEHYRLREQKRILEQFKQDFDKKLSDVASLQPPKVDVTEMIK